MSIVLKHCAREASMSILMKASWSPVLMKCSWACSWALTSMWSCHAHDHFIELDLLLTCCPDKRRSIDTLAWTICGLVFHLYQIFILGGLKFWKRFLLCSSSTVLTLLRGTLVQKPMQNTILSQKYLPQWLVIRLCFFGVRMSFLGRAVARAPISRFVCMSVIVSF